MLSLKDRASEGTLTAQRLAGGLFLPALDGGGGLALPDLGGLLIEFAAMDFGQHPGFLARALEAAHGDVKWLVFSDAYARHKLIPTSGF
jgi:hypothetical protein